MTQPALWISYATAKAAHPGVLIGVRAGDFYEFYGDDAKTVAADLNVTLTGRDRDGERQPMCGVPYHSVEKYLSALLAKGRKVALCDGFAS